MRNELYNMLRGSMKEVEKWPMDNVTIGNSPAEFAAIVKREVAYWTALVTATGIKAN